MTDTEPSVTARRFLVLFALGAVGVVALIFTTDPTLYEQAAETAGLSVAVVMVASGAQSLALVAIAVLVGLGLAPRIGLRSLVLERVSDGEPFVAALRTQARPALAGGVLVGALLFLAGFVAPTPTGGAPEQTVGSLLGSLPLRLLYGGITEELLLRWGVLSLVAYLLWRANGGEGDISTGVGWAAVLLSAVLFGVGHLPAAASSYGALTLPVLAFVIIGNSVAGVVFGWLYWRYSLEAAMVAHALGHAVAVAAGVAALLV